MTAPPEDWDDETDLLVIGSGAGGLSAAVFGVLNGARVTLCEKTEKIGGTTATSGGIVWAPGNALARAAGLQERPEAVRQYLHGELGEFRDDALLEAFIASVPQAIGTLHNRTEARFTLTDFPDYHSSRPGASERGRALEPFRFDGRRLGHDFSLVRPPLPSLMLFGGMQVNKRKVDDFLNPFRSVATLARVIRSVLRYGMDRLRYPRGTDLCAGNALVASLLYSLLQRGGRVRTETRLERLVASGGRVIGAILRQRDTTIAIRSRSGVILATGGFPSDLGLRTELMADFPHDITFGTDANRGDGIQAARAMGAALDRHVASPAYWQPSSKLPQPDGTEVGVLYGYLDRGRPGIIAVDDRGHRFVNEADSYHDVTLALFASGLREGGTFHFICDRAFVWHHGLGSIRPFRRSLRRFAKTGYITLSRSIPELAAKTGIDPTGLSETIRKHNDYARSGVDLEFGKGSTAYNRMFGHPRARGPNKNLAPIDKPPFVALRIHPGTLGTAIGLSTTENAQVRRASGDPIPGLYACGNDMASVMRGCYPAAGITLGPAIAFAYRAVNHALGRQ